MSNLQEGNLDKFANIVVSDNDPEAISLLEEEDFKHFWRNSFSYRQNKANISAGANFLRAFEKCDTQWLMIIGDDDLFDLKLIPEFLDIINSLPIDIIGVKFDSSLFGLQNNLFSIGLSDYVQALDKSAYPDAFNNLCLISNWLFQCEPCRRYISSAYLGYSSKVSHLFPLLNASSQEGLRIYFSDFKPILHGYSEESWPKAPTWFEMSITLSSFFGFIGNEDRTSLLRLIFHNDWRRNVAKCLRVQHFYSSSNTFISPFRIHCYLAVLSRSYFIALIISMPLLIIPRRLLPRFILKRLGNPGSIERW